MNISVQQSSLMTPSKPQNNIVVADMVTDTVADMDVHMVADKVADIASNKKRHG